MYLCGCWVPHIPVGFPLSVAIKEGIQRREMEANRRKSWSLWDWIAEAIQCPVLVIVPM